MVLQTRMDTYFTRMDKIIEAKKISMRVRFMLQDIMDLRKVCIPYLLYSVFDFDLREKFNSLFKRLVF
jgi:hypothetical protein